ncbi:hypothetical protein C8J56DRAFT_1171997 [Mycena floridula]|nr:hypothetical protein C8J56DRAFT_1171997 [Mycena floridula]
MMYLKAFLLLPFALSAVIGRPIGSSNQLERMVERRGPPAAAVPVSTSVERDGCHVVQNHLSAARKPGTLGASKPEDVATCLAHLAAKPDKLGPAFICGKNTKKPQGCQFLSYSKNSKFSDVTYTYEDEAQYIHPVGLVASTHACARAECVAKTK